MTANVKLAERLEAIFCDPDGDPAFYGSPGDKKEFREILEALRSPSQAQGTVLPEAVKDYTGINDRIVITRGHDAWQVYHSKRSDVQYGATPEAAIDALSKQLDKGGKRMNCPHCGSTLLWSEDRGAHCDGCDKYEPPAPIAATVETPRTIREGVRELLVFWLYAEQKPLPDGHVTAQQLKQWRDDAIGHYRNDNLFYHKVMDLSARLNKYLCSDERKVESLERDLAATRQRCERLEEALVKLMDRVTLCLRGVAEYSELHGSILEAREALNQQEPLK